MTFSFEDGFKSINGELQEVKVAILRTPQDPLELIRLDWSTQLHHALECYNVTVERDDEDQRKINISKVECHHEFEGPQIQNPDITAPLKTRQVNIGIEVELKILDIGDYWNDATVDKVIELLCEYQDLFPTKFSNFKGIVGDLGVLKITLKLNAKPVKERPYHLNPKYKEKVHLELDKMLEVGIIEPVKESDWVSPMLVQEKKQKGEI